MNKKLKLPNPELDAAKATIAELEQRLIIMEKRLAHADIETAQARVSRDTHREKVLMLVARMKEQGITFEVTQ